MSKTTYSELRRKEIINFSAEISDVENRKKKKKKE